MAAIKEVMKRKKYTHGVSLDLEKAEEIVDTMHEIENNLESSIKTDLKTIRERTNEIHEIINSIYPSDSPVPFEEFIANWSSINRERLNTIKERKSKVKEIFIKADLLQQKGHAMLSNKEFKIVQPTSDEIKELAEFYQNMDLPNIDKDLNIVSLILYLESTLSIIQNYIENFSYDEVEISDEEMRLVKRKLEELKQFQPLIQKLTDKEKLLKEKITKLKDVQDEDAPDDDYKLFDEAQGKEAIRTVISPRHFFDPSKNSINSIVLKKRKLALGEIDGTSSVDHSMHPLNQSRLYRPLSDTSLNRSKEMGPPKPKDAPSRRRRRDPMALLDKGLASSRSKPDLNCTAVNTGAIPKMISSTPFSSTMLSPDLINHANFSMISDISSVTQTPHIPNSFNNIVGHSLNVHQNIKFHVPKPDVLTSDFMDRIPWTDVANMKKLQRSPNAKTETLDEAFERRMSLFDIDQNVNNAKAVPNLKLNLNDETLYDGSKTNEFSSSSENTVCEKENFGSEIAELDTVMFTRNQACDEDLFNISDSVLVND